MRKQGDSGEMSHVNANFDSAAMPLFWKICDMLHDEVDPAEESWQLLFASPGYRTLIDNEFSEQFFRENFALAFQQSRHEALQEALTGASKGYLQHLLLAQSERAKVEGQVQWLLETPLDEMARSKAMEWLPKGTTGASPTVYFVIFGPDARGYSAVVLDVAFTLQLEDLSAALAHEYHHVYRRQLAELPGKAPEDVRDIVWVLSQLQSEGIADQIDKRNWPEGGPTNGAPSGYVERYVRHFLNSADVVQALSNGLEEYARNPNRRAEIGKRLRKGVPLAGHPTGAYMVRIIEQAFGREACIETFADPFEFTRLYSRAALRTTKAAPLSSAALQVISEIEATCET